MEYLDIVAKVVSFLAMICVSVVSFFLKDIISDHRKLRDKVEEHSVSTAKTEKDVAALTKKIDETDGAILKVERKTERDLDEIRRKQDRQDDRLIQIQKDTAGILTAVEGLSDMREDIVIIRERIAKMEGEGV